MHVSVVCVADTGSRVVLMRPLSLGWLTDILVRALGELVGGAPDARLHMRVPGPVQTKRALLAVAGHSAFEHLWRHQQPNAAYGPTLEHQPTNPNDPLHSPHEMGDSGQMNTTAMAANWFSRLGATILVVQTLAVGSAQTSTVVAWAQEMDAWFVLANEWIAAVEQLEVDTEQKLRGNTDAYFSLDPVLRSIPNDLTNDLSRLGTRLRSDGTLSALERRVQTDLDPHSLALLQLQENVFNRNLTMSGILTRWFSRDFTEEVYVQRTAFVEASDESYRAWQRYLDEVGPTDR